MAEIEVGKWYLHKDFGEIGNILIVKELGNRYYLGRYSYQTVQGSYALASIELAYWELLPIASR